MDVPAVGFSFENIIFDKWDSDQLQLNLANGQVGAFTITVTTLADPDLAPQGKHLVSAVTGLTEKCRLSPDVNSRYGAIFFNELKQHIPQLETHCFLPTGDNGQDGFIIHEVDPIYGWALFPQQSGVRRLSQYT